MWTQPFLVKQRWSACQWLRMILDADALRRAEHAFAEVLQCEANQQHAYLARLPDGHISIELEWLDLSAITRKVIDAYLAGVAGAER